MWQTLSWAFVALWFLTWIGTEVARSYVDRIRVKRSGIDGTQDVFMAGMLLLLFGVAAVVSFVMAFRRHELPPPHAPASASISATARVVCFPPAV